jgi:hypothetical protein
VAEHEDDDVEVVVTTCDADRFPFFTPTTTSVSASLSSLSLFDLEPQVRAPPLFQGMWAGLSLLDGGYMGDPCSGRPGKVSNRTGS